MTFSNLSFFLLCFFFCSCFVLLFPLCFLLRCVCVRRTVFHTNSSEDAVDPVSVTETTACAPCCWSSFCCTLALQSFVAMMDLLHAQFLLLSAASLSPARLHPNLLIEACIGPIFPANLGTTCAILTSLFLPNLCLSVRLPLMHAGTTLYWSSKRKPATHSITAAPSTLRIRHTSRSAKGPPYAAKTMTPLEWRTGGRTYTARWPQTDKPGSSMGRTFTYVPPANTGMSAVQWHMFGLRKTSATSCLSTAVATAASARSELISAAKSRQAQPGPPARSMKEPATVNTINLSCSSHAEATVGLATADKRRTGLLGNQTAPRMLLTDCCDRASVGVHAAVPVAGDGDKLEGTAAQMQASSQQVHCLLSRCLVRCVRQILPFLPLTCWEFTFRAEVISS